jgi:hypothetical protein
MRSIEEQIGATLANEDGGELGLVCIWREGDNGCVARKCTVKDWLSRPENQSGTWLIDGGWGGPPGPIHVRWAETRQEWENGGFCGRKFNRCEE